MNGSDVSIMIPTYNCAGYLRCTLESLRLNLNQIRGAQIVVVDDCSTRDCPKSVVDAFPDLSIEFFRHEKNVGPARNFNKCIELATREWVHILHGDDVMQDGGYENVFRIVNTAGDLDAAFFRVSIIDEDGRQVGKSPQFPEAGSGNYNPLSWRVCYPQFAGTFFRRAVAVGLGGFNEAYQCVQDWDLWWRIARTGRVHYSNELVGGYRIFQGNHSSGARKTGLFLREAANLLGRIVSSDACTSSPVEIFHPVFVGNYELAKELAGKKQLQRTLWTELCNLPMRTIDRLKLVRLWISGFMQSPRLVSPLWLADLNPPRDTAKAG